LTAKNNRRDNSAANITGLYNIGDVDFTPAHREHVFLL